MNNLKNIFYCLGKLEQCRKGPGERLDCDSGSLPRPSALLSVSHKGRSENTAKASSFLPGPNSSPSFILFFLKALMGNKQIPETPNQGSQTSLGTKYHCRNVYCLALCTAVPKASSEDGQPVDHGYTPQVRAEKWAM